MPGGRNPIRLDLNSPEFQDVFFRLETPDLKQVVASLRRLRELDWNSLYRHTGFRWETIQHLKAPNGATVYSLRLSQRIRGVAYRDGDFLRLISLHPDHDSAYGRGPRQSPSRAAHPRRAPGTDDTEHLAAAGISAAEMQVLLEAIASVVEPIRLSYLWRPLLPDAQDDMVLETAVNGRADLLVTVNRRHFEPAAATFGLNMTAPGRLRRLESPA